MIAVVQAITPAEGAAAATDLPAATVLDLADYGADRVLIIVTFGAITAGATTSIKAQLDNVLAFNDDVVDIAGSAQTVAADQDNTTFLIDVINPTRRFLRLFVARATQTSAVGAAYYLVYGCRNKPITQVAPVHAPEIHRNKAEGTA
jgi:hypothetical protein